MDKFMEELAALLDFYNATILRSANSTHDLVISIIDDNGEYIEVHFKEEMSAHDLRRKLDEMP